MYCSRCGSFNEDGTAVCRSCGQPLNSGEDQTGEEAPTSMPSARSSGGIAQIIKAVCLLLAAYAALSALLNVGSIFSGIISIFGGYRLYAICNLLCRVLLVLSRALLAAGLLLMGLCYDSRKGNADQLLLTVAVAGGLRIILEFVARVLFVISALFQPGISRSFGLFGFFRLILYVVGVIIVLFVLLSLDGNRLFAVVPQDGILGLVQDLPNHIANEVKALNRKSEQMNPDGGIAAEYSFTERPRVQEDRSVLRFYLLGILTCGIYQLYVYHTLARDINRICEGDGEKETPGIARYILFSLITLGIYHIVWHYRMLTRVQKAAIRYDIPMKTVANMELNIFWLVFYLAGILLSLFGIGIVIQVYAYYVMFANINALSRAYNSYNARF